MNDIVLVIPSTIKTPSVIEAEAHRKDALAASEFLSRSNEIKKKMSDRMGPEGKYLFNNLFSEATVCDTKGNNLVNGEYYSFIGLANGKLYFSKNTVDSEIYEYPIIPQEVQANEVSDENKINVSDVQIPDGTLDNAFNKKANSEVQFSGNVLENDTIDGVPFDPTVPGESPMTMPSESTPAAEELVSEEVAPVEAEPIHEEVAPVEAEPISEEAAPVEAEPIPEEVAPVEAEPIPEEVAPVEAEPIPKEVAPVEAEPIPEEAAPVEAEPIPEKVAPVEAEPIPEEVAPVEVESVPEETSTSNLESIYEPEKMVFNNEPEDEDTVETEEKSDYVLPYSNERVESDYIPSHYKSGSVESMHDNFRSSYNHSSQSSDIVSVMDALINQNTTLKKQVADFERSLDQALRENEKLREELQASDKKVIITDQANRRLKLNYDSVVKELDKYKNKDRRINQLTSRALEVIGSDVGTYNNTYMDEDNYYYGANNNNSGYNRYRA